MSQSTWLHPLVRASRVLTVRLMELERMPDTSRDAAWWGGYVATCDALARMIQVTRGVTWGEASGEPRRRVGKVGA